MDNKHIPRWVYSNKYDSILLPYGMASDGADDRTEGTSPDWTELLKEEYITSIIAPHSFGYISDDLETTLIITFENKLGYCLELALVGQYYEKDNREPLASRIQRGAEDLSNYRIVVVYVSNINGIVPAKKILFDINDEKKVITLYCIKHDRIVTVKKEYPKELAEIEKRMSRIKDEDKLKKLWSKWLEAKRNL